MIYMSKCSVNEIERIGYSYKNKSGKQVDVKPTCIKDKGKPVREIKYFFFQKKILDYYQNMVIN